jgi:hypothetical protein
LNSAGSDPVGNHIHYYSSAGGMLQGIPDTFTGGISGKNVCLQIDFRFGRIERSLQCRKVFSAAMQKRDLIMSGKGYRTHILKGIWEQPGIGSLNGIRRVLRRP